MKRIILMVLLTSSLFSQDILTKDFWQQDKQKHFLASATIAGAGTGLAKHYGSSKIEAFFIGFGSALTIGILKELADGNGYGSEDIGDVYADMLGAGTGALISAKFEWKF